MSSLRYGDTVRSEDIDGYDKMPPKTRARIKKWLDKYHMPPNARLKAEHALDAILAVRSGRATVADKAEEYGVAEATIRDAVTGRRWASRLYDGGYLHQVEYRLPRTRAVSREEEQQIVDLLRDGPLTVARIAKDYGISPTTVYRISERNNRDPRNRYIKRHCVAYARENTKLSDEERMQLYDLVNYGGFSTQEAADLYDVSRSHVWRISRTEHQRNPRCRSVLESYATGNRKLHVRDAQEIYDGWLQGKTQSELATEWGVSQPTIHAIISGKTYKEIDR